MTRPWRVWATEVRPWNGGLQWELQARQAGECSPTIVAETCKGGRLFDLQCGSCVGSTGDLELDEAVAQRLRELVSHCEILHKLDTIDGPRRRSDRLRRAA